MRRDDLHNPADNDTPLGRERRVGAGGGGEEKLRVINMYRELYMRAGALECISHGRAFMHRDATSA